MSRRTRARATRTMEPTGPSGPGVAVYTPTRKGYVGKGLQLIMVAKGTDPHGPGIVPTLCRSHRPSRAAREAKAVGHMTVYQQDPRTGHCVKV